MRSRRGTYVASVVSAHRRGLKEFNGVRTSADSKNLRSSLRDGIDVRSVGTRRSPESLAGTSERAVGAVTAPSSGTSA